MHKTLVWMGVSIQLSRTKVFTSQTKLKKDSLNLKPDLQKSLFISYIIDFLLVDKMKQSSCFRDASTFNQFHNNEG